MRRGLTWALPALAAIAGWPVEVRACLALDLFTPEDVVAEATLILRARAVEYVGDLHDHQGDLDVLDDLRSRPSLSGPAAFGETRSLWQRLSCLLFSCSPWRILELEVLEVLKGASAPQRVHVLADEVPFRGRNRGPVPYRVARPGADGPCFAFDYRLGREYLLFFREGQLYFRGLAPLNEEVDGPDDPWVTWVRGAL